MQIASCNSYHARVDDFRLVQSADGKSVFKFYFCSIIGRSEPEPYQWSAANLSMENCLSGFQQQNFVGLGFVTAFPHICKVFRFAPQAETLLHVCAYNPRTSKAISLQREKGYTEFACLAEAVLAAAEYRFWADASSVPEYLAQHGNESEFPIAKNDKLKQYWGIK